MATFIMSIILAILATSLASEAVQSYPGFENVGTYSFVPEAGDGIGVASDTTKTFFLSSEAALWFDAYYHCTNSIKGGRMLTLTSLAEGTKVKDLLTQNEVQSGAIWTGAERDLGTWVWNSPPYHQVPQDFWADGEPNPEPGYDVACFVKSGIRWALQAYRRASSAMERHRYVCEVVTTVD